MKMSLFIFLQWMSACHKKRERGFRHQQVNIVLSLSVHHILKPGTCSQLPIGCSRKKKYIWGNSCISHQISSIILLLFTAYGTILPITVFHMRKFSFLGRISDDSTILYYCKQFSKTFFILSPSKTISLLVSVSSLTLT